MIDKKQVLAADYSHLAPRTAFVQMLKSIMAAEGLNQTTLARMMGYHPSTVRQWVVDEHLPIVANFECLAKMWPELKKIPGIYAKLMDRAESDPETYEELRAQRDEAREDSTRAWRQVDALRARVVQLETSDAGLLTKKIEDLETQLLAAWEAADAPRPMRRQVA